MSPSTKLAFTSIQNINMNISLIYVSRNTRLECSVLYVRRVFPVLLSHYEVLIDYREAVWHNLCCVSRLV